MTDLSTKHIQRLLAEATPGPWRFSEDTADTPSGTQEYGHEVYADEKYLFSVWGDPVTDEHPGIYRSPRWPQTSHKKYYGYEKSLSTGLTTKRKHTTP